MGPQLTMKATPHPVRTSAGTRRTPSRTLHVFVDESGNTGDAAKLTDAFGGQPSFALAAVGEPAGSGQLDRILLELRDRHRIQAPEVKSRVLGRRPNLC